LGNGNYVHDVTDARELRVKKKGVFDSCCDGHGSYSMCPLMATTVLGDDYHSRYGEWNLTRAAVDVVTGKALPQSCPGEWWTLTRTLLVACGAGLGFILLCVAAVVCCCRCRRRRRQAHENGGKGGDGVVGAASVVPSS
jgi:hypothetical protein